VNVEFETQAKPSLIPLQSPGRLEELEALINECFAVPRGKSFYDDFPVWDPRSGQKIFRIGAIDTSQTKNGDLAAASLVRIANLRLGGQTLPIALIGGVCTDPNYRSQGLASQVVTRSCDWAKEKGAKLAVLWGSEVSLYQKLGFSLTGEQWQVPLASLPLFRGGNAPVSTVPVQTGFCDGIFEEMKKRTTGLALEEEDLRWMKKHRHVEWYYTGARTEVTAYAAINRGIDLEGIVHEWGGDPEALRALLATIAWQHPTASLLGPRDGLIDLFLSLNLKAVPDTATQQSLALIRILDSEGAHALSSENQRLLWFWGLDAC
jgi:GNAT superfamily N-acetyltransferase